jgi:hemerythrin superfamily protein
MDVLTLLKQDHADVKDLFKRIEHAKDSKAREIWEEISTKLTLHEELEETHFYPKLKEEEAARDLVLESYQEHHVLDLLIEEITRLTPDDEAWEPKLKVLQENVEHHIEEEEKELFPKVRKIWSTERRTEVGETMLRMKQQRTPARRAA